MFGNQIGKFIGNPIGKFIRNPLGKFMNPETNLPDKVYSAGIT
jgi:hypothetical protein